MTPECLFIIRNSNRILNSTTLTITLIFPIMDRIQEYCYEENIAS
jgi:hypothetical protein